jgi:hypothetical protein
MNKSIQLISILMVVFLIDCGGSVKSTKSGFLGDYSQFKPAPEGEVLVYLNPYKSIGEYDKLMFDPVTIYLHPDAKGKEIDPETLKELSDYFKEEGLKAVEGAYEVVEEPGTGVLRVKAAITDVNTSAPLKNIITTYFVKFSTDVGGASIEAELVDSQTNERIVGFVETRKGRAFLNRKNLITRYGDVKGSLKYWAQLLRDRLDAAHEKSE